MTMNAAIHNEVKDNRGSDNSSSPRWKETNKNQQRNTVA